MRRWVPAIAGSVSVLLAGCDAGAASSERTPSYPPPATTAAPSTPVATPTPSQDWASVLGDMRSAVLRISVVDCEDRGPMGSGFLLDDDLVMTAAHVVKGSRTISVQTESGELTSAEIVGLDESVDAALLRTADPIPGTPIVLKSDPVQQGSDLAVLGFPLGAYDLRMATGIVSGVNENVAYPDFTVDRVFTTDAATNGGNSGGPVVNRERLVIGLVSGGVSWDSSDAVRRRPVVGINYVVPSDDLVAKYEEWAGSDALPSQCEEDRGAPAPESQGELDVYIDSAAPEARAIAQSLFNHGRSINEGSYSAAWTLFSPRMQRRIRNPDTWADGLETSYWTRLRIFNVRGSGPHRRVDATLRTRQSAERGYRGQECSVFHLTYHMRLMSGVWRIDRARLRRETQGCQ